MHKIGGDNYIGHYRSNVGGIYPLTIPGIYTPILVLVGVKTLKLQHITYLQGIFSI